MRRPTMQVAALVTAAVALIAAAAVVFAITGAPATRLSTAGAGASAGRGSTPKAGAGAGTVVNVSVKDSGGPMGEGGGPLHGGAMSLKADRTTVPHGTVSFRVTNAGAVHHEMVILPLGNSKAVGARPFGGDARVDEAGSLGEVSRSDGGKNDSGIVPGTSGHVTLSLKPGQYELVCNVVGHYASGMFTKLTVT
jgi:uncharacterized cupredoxin-like copper-binding protein